MSETTATATPSQETKRSGRSRIWRICKWASLCLVVLVVLGLGVGELVGEWHIGLLSSEDGTYLVILEAMDVHMTPSNAPAFGVCLGTPSISFFSYSLGWRTHFDSAQTIDHPNANGEVIEVTLRSGSKQYYAPCDGQLSLIRLEGSTGKSWKNIYHAPNITIGPRPPHAPEEEWEQALLSNEKVEILRTLVWLDGVHLDVTKKPQENVHHQDLREASLCDAVLKRPAVQKRLKELSQSPDQWIREAATSALKPIRSHPYMH